MCWRLFLLQILSYYQLKRVDYIFLDLIDKYIIKYPFKFYYIMEKLNNNNLVFIKDTTMIIDLLKLEEDMIVNIFNLFKEMLRNNLIKKIVYKKEVIVVYFSNEFIISYFKEKNKWLLIPLINILIEKDEVIYFDVYIKTSDIYKFMLLVKINEKYVTIDLYENNKMNDNHLPLILSFNNNRNNNLQFSFDKSEFLGNLNSKINV